MFKNKECE